MKQMQNFANEMLNMAEEMMKAAKAFDPGIEKVSMSMSDAGAIITFLMDDGNQIDVVDMVDEIMYNIDKIGTCPRDWVHAKRVKAG